MKQLLTMLLIIFNCSCSVLFATNANISPKKHFIKKKLHVVRLYGKSHDIKKKYIDKDIGLYVRENLLLEKLLKENIIYFINHDDDEHENFLAALAISENLCEANQKLILNYIETQTNYVSMINYTNNSTIMIHSAIFKVAQALHMKNSSDISTPFYKWLEKCLSALIQSTIKNNISIEQILSEEEFKNTLVKEFLEIFAKNITLD